MAHTARLKVAVEARLVVSDATRDALIALGWTPPNTVIIDGQDATDHVAGPPEPIGDLDITPYLVVHRYRTDRGEWAWLWRCWGDGPCDGWLALDLSNRAYAERNARKHLVDEHPDATLEQILPGAREQQ